MNRKVKYMLSVIGEDFLYIVISLALICVGGAVFNKALWIASVITGGIYLSSLYSSAWRNSGKDFRWANARLKQGETDKLDYRIYDGFLHALPLLVLSALIWVLYLAIGGAMFTVYRVYNFAFVNIFDKIKTPYVFEVIVLILPYLSYSIGYIVGKSRKTFVTQHINKLIYKQKKKTDKK